jgi:putative flippase GtrA
VLWDEEQAWIEHTNRQRDTRRHMHFIERLFFTIVWVLVALFLGVWILRQLSQLPNGIGQFFSGWGHGLEFQS